MTEHIQASISHHTGVLTLSRPQALNSLSLDMVRAITATLLIWRDDPAIAAVVIRSASEKAFCAGGDIRFFYVVGNAAPRGGSALLEDFFTEEYALNHLIHHYPKPYIALMDGIVMGGGMGISQCASSQRLRIVTERTRMAMPEVNIGIFPDVGGSYFLSRAPGKLGVYLALTGETIGAADALYAGLADTFLPSAQLPALVQMLESTGGTDIDNPLRNFAAPFQVTCDASSGMLARHRADIDQHFSHEHVASIMESLHQDRSPFAQQTLATMSKRSPLMMCVTHEQLRRGASMSIADCLRMERSMVRHCFEAGEVLEGVRAAVIDKDGAPQWMHASVDEVEADRVARFFVSAWPAHAHPLRNFY